MEALPSDPTKQKSAELHYTADMDPLKLLGYPMHMLVLSGINSSGVLSIRLSKILFLRQEMIFTCVRT